MNRLRLCIQLLTMHKSRLHLLHVQLAHQLGLHFS